ncbi:MAG TPA: type III-A CRISPR-associated protein Csm2 [Candidatus Rifleibacterium sp.]|nr:type III-A CRISPR-associated protein Csm2 [Candidatus Rifleibacterium sp.]
MAIQFWEDRAKKIPKTDLFSKVAETEARLVQEQSTDTVNKLTQLRKFFDEIVSFEARYRMAAGKATSDEERARIFKQQLPFAHMLIPKVKYAEARKLVSPGFAELIRSAVIDNLKEPEDLKMLKSFFEAFTGYYRYEKEDARNRQAHAREGRR